jgi:hypothetical protein
LSYVAAIVRSANDASLSIELVTSRVLTLSDEYQIHLARLVADGQLTVRTSDRLDRRGGITRELREIRLRGNAVVLPEADRSLHALLLAKLSRGLPVPTALIVMRPPQSVRGIWRARIGGFVKTLLIVVLCAWSSLDVLLLEDPLALGRDRVWRKRVLRSKSRRLDDPCGLVEIEASHLPKELNQDLGDRPMLAIVGVIDSRKQVPLVWAAWQLACGTIEGELVIAGKQSPDVSSWLRSAGPVPTRIHFIDRYLTDDEVRGVLERSNGIITLYDGGFSSGFLVAAAAVGRWAITTRGSRIERVASSHGFAVTCTPTPSGIAEAIDQVLAKTEMPPPIEVPSAEDFGRRVLRRLIDSRKV